MEHLTKEKRTGIVDEDVEGSFLAAHSCPAFLTESNEFKSSSRIPTYSKIEEDGNEVRRPR